ncbi:MBL fold metallo-hydrolase [Mucilaginibacter ximonensis]|uniref:MBL fold metallo-hydrolase n=1 Tax=Mucilaginibacter ximonensis TaxID=538021 RepID=A0ABW5YD35_9SPHI
MSQVKVFPNNPFQENTHIIYDETGACAIIDPGMDNAAEQNAVVNFIKQHNLKPALLLNTHCHIDHILGNKFIFDMYGLKPQFHEGEVHLLEAGVAYAPQFGLRYEPSPVPEVFLGDEGTVCFGNTTLKLIFAPGHSPAHLCFYNEKDNFLIGGDVLFAGSIGRTDLPGGDFKTLIDNIEQKLLVLPDDCRVYPGHGPSTTIGQEKLTNPFLV